jgi:hypothetical protein
MLLTTTGRFGFLEIPKRALNYFRSFVWPRIQLLIAVEATVPFLKAEAIIIPSSKYNGQVVALLKSSLH